MTTVVLDEANSARPLGEFFKHPFTQAIQFCDTSGRIVGTLLLNDEESERELARAVAEAEANIEELRRRAATPREQCFTTAEVLARARSLAPD